MRALAMFLAVIFLIYTFAHDYQQRQASLERYQAIAQYTEESRAALQAAKQQSEQFEASLKNTTALLVFMEEMAKGMKEVSEILRNQQREHQVIMNGTAPKKRPVTEKKKRTPTLRKCFEFRERKKRVGNNEITIHEGIDIPCE